MNTTDAVLIVAGARSAAELFAADGQRTYRRLARLLHPDVSPDTADAFTRLATLWDTYNHGQLVGSYRVGPPLHKGGTAVLYPANEDLVLKLPRDPADNHRIRHEAEALAAIAAGGDPRLLPYIPRLVETFRHKSGGKIRQANVISRAPAGFVTLADIDRKLDPRDAAWIWRRLLVALGLAHRAGVSHGAVLPRHVLVHPIEHGLILIDWCRYGNDQASDIKYATKCVEALLGPHPRRMAAFLNGCVRRPPSDAWALLEELDDLLDDLEI